MSLVSSGCNVLNDVTNLPYKINILVQIVEVSFKCILFVLKIHQVA